MRAVSLFSGAGGFELGFERAGIETVLQVEIDPVCLSVLERHWPETERLHDVRDVDGGFVPNLRGYRPEPGLAVVAGRQAGEDVDLVYGGFPCQDVSVAGQRAGLRGERSGLWHEFQRVLSELRPRWVVIENVPGLLSSGAEPGADFGVVLRGLVDLGYGVAWRVLDARWFGVPQRRRRVFVVGCLGDAQRAAQVLAVCESCGGHPEAGSEAGQDVAHALRASLAKSNGSPERGDLDLIALDPMQVHRRQFHDPRDLDAEPCCFECCDCTDDLALRASDGHHGHSSPRGDGADTLIAFDWQTEGSERTRPHASGEYTSALEAGKRDAIAFHMTQDPINSPESPSLGGNAYVGVSNTAGVRRLTPLECERLMGWPDEHTRYAADGREIPDSHRYRLCGNGVVAPVAEWLGHRLVRVNCGYV